MTADTRPVAQAMQRAALDLLDAVGPPASLPFESDARVDWAFYPRESVGEQFHGVALLDLDAKQRRLVRRLLGTGLSLAGLAQVEAIRALEAVLDVAEGSDPARLRDPQRFWVAIFGDPGDVAWGWRFEGHHVSVNHTLVDGAVAASTPLFAGSNPARSGPRSATRPCGPEEDAARELLEGLPAEQLRRAIVSAEVPVDLVVLNTAEVPDSVGPGETGHPFDHLAARYADLSDAAIEALRYDRARPRGLARGDMEPPLRVLLDELVELYLGRLPEPLAVDAGRRLDRAGRDDLWFAWAGSTRRGEPHYYRLQGPTLLVEYDCIQNDANHVHTVWRDPHRDFGADLLARHRAFEH